MVFGDSLEEVPVRGNPNLTKVVHYENFAGGYRVGRSEAVHACGEECGKHNHRGANEEFYVLAGTGTIEVGDVRHEVRAGVSVMVPVGVSHNLIGTSEDPPFRVLCDFTVVVGHEDDETPWKATDA